MAYWYNIETGQVESEENRSRGADVMGPYESEDEARNALATARAKTEEWDEQDRREQEWPGAADE